MTNFRKHRLYYFLLISILLLGFSLVVVSSPDRILQGQFIVATGICYFLFGTVHHIQNHDFHVKIVVEYALIASLGIASALFMLKVGLGL